MLKQLYIKNFTLIDELDIPLYPGFSVITGETGAGKSIILGAIGLLLGNLDEVCGFPSQPHDEFVDILGYAINDLYDEDDDIDYDVLSKSSLGM